MNRIAAILLILILPAMAGAQQTLPPHELVADKRPFLLRELGPYSADPQTALLLHLDGSLDGAAGKVHSEGLRWSNSGLFGRADRNNQSSAALRCDGNQQIAIPFSADVTDGFTTECWVWLERPAEATERYHIVTCPKAFELFVDANRDRESRVLANVRTDQGGYTLRSWIPVCYRRWMHVAMIYDPAARHPLQLLINGSPAHNWRRYEGLPQVEGRLLSTRGQLNLADGFRGLIDEVRVSTRALSSREIMARWPSGRLEDHEPFEPDVVGPEQPHGGNPAALSLTAVQAVPTFNSIGLYLRSRADVNANGKCRVRFREQDSVR